MSIFNIAEAKTRFSELVQKATCLVGIRSGEKWHEVICPQDDSHLTPEFDDHYANQPANNFWDGNDHAYDTNALSEKGRRVEQGFEYNYGTNSHCLGVEEIRVFNHLAAVK